MKVRITVTFDNGHEYEMDIVRSKENVVTFPIHKRKNAPFMDVARLELSIEALSKPEDDTRLAAENDWHLLKERGHGKCL